MSFWPNWKENAFFSFFVTLLILALGAFIGLKAWNAYAEHDAIGRAPLPRNTVTIDGNGKVTGKPTLANVEVGVYSQGKDVPSVQTDNTQKVNAVIAAVKALGVVDADIQTSNYSISPQFDYNNGKQTLIGYTVSQSVNVKVRDLTKVGDVLDKAGSLGANQINGVTFSIDDPTSLQADARKKALDDARSKADQLAGALGLHVVRVVGFSESSSNVTPPMPFYAKADMMNVASAVPSIQAGSLDVTSNVSVTYEIQ